MSKKIYGTCIKQNTDNTGEMATATTTTRRSTRIRVRKPAPLIIQQSNIVGAGQGVFARADIPSGTFLCDYYGASSTLAPEVEGDYKLIIERRPHWLSSHRFHLREHRVVDAENHVTAGPYPNFGRFVNGCCPKKPEQEQLVNAEFRDDGSIWTTADVKRGSEIILDYGDFYW